jgi:hypothetical protein
VQALVRPVVLRPSWYDAVLADTECDPPHRELAEATAGGSGTRGAMVGADRRQQAVRMQRRSKLGLASTGLVESRAAPLRRNRLEASATVQGQPYSPSPVRNWPLQSAVQTVWGAAACRGSAPGWRWRRRRVRDGLRPTRWQRGPAVLAAGQVSSGRRRAREGRSLRGPQWGCARFASRRAAATSAARQWGQRCGARLCSWSPTTRCSVERRTHLSPVWRRMPKRSHRSVMEYTSLQ